MTDLIALAERVEKATGPDRELEQATCLAIRKGRWISPDAVPAYTSSLDAAMTLVPEDIGATDGDYWRPEVARTHRGTWSARITPPWNGEHNARVFKSAGDEASPALALTAACLRARAAKMPA